jgi:hypothetical protein
MQRTHDQRRASENARTKGRATRAAASEYAPARLVVRSFGCASEDVRALPADAFALGRALAATRTRVSARDADALHALPIEHLVASSARYTVRVVEALRGERVDDVRVRVGARVARARARCGARRRGDGGGGGSGRGRRPVDEEQRAQARGVRLIAHG